MSVLEPPARLAVRNIEELVGLVPFLIGFHPSESLVLMVIDQGQVVVTARVDLVALDNGDHLADLMIRVFDRFPRASGWFFAFTDDDALGWQVLGEAAVQLGITRVGRLIQVGGGYCRLDDPAGRLLTLGESVSAAAAQAAMLGLPARPSRQVLADSIAGPPDEEVGELLEQFESEADRLAGFTPRGRLRLLKQLLRRDSPSVIDLVALAILVSTPESAMTVIGQFSRNNADQQVRLWTQVIRHCLLSHQPVPLGLLGLAGWLSGDGALQMVCLERLDLIRPDLPLAAWLEWINDEVMPPTEWPQLRTSVLAGMADALLLRERGRSV